jgi:hypothetical protein
MLATCSFPFRSRAFLWETQGWPSGRASSLSPALLHPLTEFSCVQSQGALDIKAGDLALVSKKLASSSGLPYDTSVFEVGINSLTLGIYHLLHSTLTVLRVPNRPIFETLIAFFSILAWMHSLLLHFYGTGLHWDSLSSSN